MTAPAPLGKPSLNIFLLYEPNNDAIALLNGSLVLPVEIDNSTQPPVWFSNSPIWSWDPISNQLQASNTGTGLQFGAPFASFSGKTIFAGKHENGSFSDQGLMSKVYGDDGSLFTSQYNGFDRIILDRN